MEVTPHPTMMTFVRPEQPENAPSPMEVTLLSMVTLVRPEQPENAESPMEVTPMVAMVLALGKTYTPLLPAGKLMSKVSVLSKRTPSMLL